MTAGATGADLEEILRAALDAAFECGRCSDADKGAAIDAIVQVVRGHFDALNRPAPDPTAPVGSEELTGAVDAEGLDGILAEQEADEALLSEPIRHTLNGIAYLIAAGAEFEAAGADGNVARVKEICDNIYGENKMGRPPEYSLKELAELGKQFRAEFCRQKNELKMTKTSKRKAANDIAAKGIWKNKYGKPRTGEDLRCNWLGKALDAESLIFKQDMFRRRIRFHWDYIG